MPPGRHQPCNCVSQVSRIGGSAALVVNYRNWFVLGGKPQHRFDEIRSLSTRTPDAVETAGSNHDMLRTRAAHEKLAGEFAGAINADGSGDIRFSPRRLASGVEPKDVIGAEMDECDVALSAERSQ